jgi:hypothetical protein
MTLLHALGVGFFILILVYLGVKNANGVVAIFNAGGQNTNQIVKSLQGR